MNRLRIVVSFLAGLLSLICSCKGVDVTPKAAGPKSIVTKTVYGEPSLTGIFETRFDHPARRAASHVARVRFRGSDRRCTSFLIDPGRGIMLTAGHCLADIVEPSQVRLEFYKSATDKLDVGIQKILVNKSIDSAFLYLSNDGLDYSRKLEALNYDLAWKPHPRFVSAVSTSNSPSGLYLMGFPAQDPLSISYDCVAIRSDFRPNSALKIPLVACDCDASGGNSGSPVFSAESNAVVGMFWGGEIDTRTGIRAGYNGPFELFVRLTTLRDTLQGGIARGWIEKAGDLEKSEELSRMLGFAFDGDTWTYRKRVTECVDAAVELAPLLRIETVLDSECADIKHAARFYGIRSEKEKAIVEKYYPHCVESFYHQIDLVAKAIPAVQLGNGFSAEMARLKLDNFSGCANEFALR